MDNGTHTAGHKHHVNFDASACLRKWPSLNNQRSPRAPAPYLVLDGTLDQCLREFMAKPAGSRHLYEIFAQAQLPLVQAALIGEIILELTRLQDLL